MSVSILYSQQTSFITIGLETTVVIKIIFVDYKDVSLFFPSAFGPPSAAVGKLTVCYVCNVLMYIGLVISSHALCLTIMAKMNLRNMG